MDDIEMCGNDLRFILERLRHYQGTGPDDKRVISALAAVTQSLVQVLASSQLTNKGLAREYGAEAGKALTASAGKLASVSQAAA